MFTLEERLIKLYSYDYLNIDETYIKNTLERYPQNEEMIRFLSLTYFKNEKDFNFQEIKKYHEILLKTVLSFTKKKYPEKYYNLFLAFQLMNFITTESEVKNLIEKQIEFFEKEIEDMDDEIWYIFHHLKYSLLRICNLDLIYNSYEAREKMRKIALALIANKEKYENLEKRFKKEIE